MIDQRNTIIAIVISLLILIGWEYFFVPTPEPGLTPPAGQETRPDVSMSSPVKVPDDISAIGITTPETSNEVNREISLDSDQRVKINTDSLHGTLSLKGARFDDITLAKYRDTSEQDSNEIVLLSPAQAPNPYYAELGWVSADTSLALPKSDTLWSIASKNTALTPEQSITLTWNGSQNLTFTRTISVDDDYMFTVAEEIRNNSGEPVTLFPYGLVVRLDTPDTLGFFILHEGPLGVFNDTLKEVDYEDIRDDGDINVETTGGWIGFTDKYWLTALAFDQSTSATAGFRHTLRSGRDRYQTDFRGNAMEIPANGRGSITTYFFAGAKEVELLDGYAKNLGVARFDLAIDFGWFYFLTKPFFYSLIWLRDQLGNFGLAIIAFTVFLRLLVFPLANKQYRAMTKLKALQPEMKKLQERYANDRPRLNQELMELYKREKANPASGCLPILIQIPVFFALYKVLFVSIEMRQAPFYGWIKDLSAPDPTSVFNLFGLLPYDVPGFLTIGAWPIIMGTTMWLQMKINPQIADPLQAKIMSFLPVIFTVLLATFPAGLVIYWAWSNALGILQQWVIMRQANVRA